MLQKIVVSLAIALFAIAGCTTKADQLKALYTQSIAANETCAAALEKAATPEEVAAAITAWGEESARIAAAQKQLQKTDPVKPDEEQFKKMMDAIQKQGKALVATLQKKEFLNNKTILDAYAKAAQKVADASK